jgi:hypothetical protein
MIQARVEDYLDYLAPLVGVEPGESYWTLLKLMHEKEFVWFVPNDDNRIKDGLDVRVQWLMSFDGSGLQGPVSFLEVLVGLSRRMEFFTGESAEGWGWQFLVNLGLDRMRDPLNRRKQNRVDEILDTVIFRTYRSDGTGGFFPLTRPREDQREVELWFQMSEYVHEIHPEY